MNARPSSTPFRNLKQEHGLVPLEIEGTVPADLRGTLYRNGPGQFSLFGESYRHYFDCDGVVTSFQVDNGTVQGACRVAETATLKEERTLGRRIYDSGMTRVGAGGTGSGRSRRARPISMCCPGRDGSSPYLNAACPWSWTR